MPNQSRWDRMRSFLYRFGSPGSSPAKSNCWAAIRWPIDNKFQVNSLQDVFCHPFYWQLYTWLDQPPQLVVDLGCSLRAFQHAGGCLCSGCDLATCNRNICSSEPNPSLIPVIRRNLSKSGLCARLSFATGTGWGEKWQRHVVGFIQQLSVRKPATRTIHHRRISLVCRLG